MAKKASPSNGHKQKVGSAYKREISYAPGTTSPRSGQYAVRRDSIHGEVLPPAGPSNIIVRTANPLPAPKSVESQ